MLLWPLTTTVWDLCCAVLFCMANLSLVVAGEGWMCLKRCWLVAALVCAKLSSPLQWRCWKFSCRMLGDWVISFSCGSKYSTFRAGIKLYFRSVTYLTMYLTIYHFLMLTAAMQRKPGIIPSTRLATTNAVLSRSYNVVPQAVSATQIARQLLHTEGIQGLYKGLGATLLR